MKAWEYIKSDFNAAMDNDPALPRNFKGALEIIFCTQGFLAITCHRGIHFLHSQRRRHRFDLYLVVGNVGNGIDGQTHQ